jgi:outer membrane protein
MLKNREGVLWGLVLLALVLSGMSVYKSYFTSETVVLNKTGYVEIAVVFEQFEMKKELQATLESDLQSKQFLLDSLMFQLQTLNNKLSSEAKPEGAEIQKFQQLQNYYAQQKEVFDNYSYDKTAQLDKQIITQMSQYIKDYGKANGYDYIFGATGTGNILYAPESANVTKEIIEYINNSVIKVRTK